MADDETEIVLRVERPVFPLGALPGDEILLRPGHPTHPVVLLRYKDALFGALAAAVAAGLVTTISESPARVLALLASCAVAPPPPRPRVRPTRPA